MPAKTSTLTQRRSGSSGPMVEINDEKMANLRSVGDMPTSDNGSIFKIILWGIIILALGIGLALLVRKLTSDNNTDTTSESDQTQEDTTDTTEDITTDETDTDEEDTTGDTTTDTTDEEADTTAEETTADTTTTTPGLTNEYSTSAQSISDGLTTNSITIAGYSYGVYSDRIEYNIKLASTEKYPDVTGALDSTEKTLTIVVSNISRDNIVGNNGEGSTVFNSSPNTTSVDISNASNKSTFVFNLTKATQYKINAVEEDGVKMLRVTIKNS